jgi:hypothetical protein
LFELCVAEQVNSRVTDVSHDHLVVVANHRTDGRSHSLQVGVIAHSVRQLLCAVFDGFDEGLLGNINRLEPLVCD